MKQKFTSNNVLWCYTWPNKTLLQNTKKNLDEQRPISGSANGQKKIYPQKEFFFLLCYFNLFLLQPIINWWGDIKDKQQTTTKLWMHFSVSGNISKLLVMADLDGTVDGVREKARMAKKWLYLARSGRQYYGINPIHYCYCCC